MSTQTIENASPTINPVVTLVTATYQPSTAFITSLDFNKDHVTDIKKGLDKFYKKLDTTLSHLQDDIHAAAISVTILAWVNDDTSHVEKLLNTLARLKGFARGDRLAYWFTNVAGLECVPGKIKDTYQVSKCKSKSRGAKSITSKLAKPVDFTYDSVHLDKCKSLKFYDKQVLAHDPLVITVPKSVEAAFSSVINNLANGLAVEAFTEDEIDSQIALLKASILAKKAKVEPEKIAAYKADQAKKLLESLAA